MVSGCNAKKEKVNEQLRIRYKETEGNFGYTKPITQSRMNFGRKKCKRRRRKEGKNAKKKLRK